MITTLEFAQNVGLALFLGALIGLERELRARDAGMRTNALVAAGAAIFSMISRSYGDSRIASQIITGIGFIGAGNILKDGAHVRGLTTAATLWSVAGIGMAIGLGRPAFGLIAAVAVLIVNLVLLPLDHWLLKHHITPGEPKPIDPVQ